MNLFPRHSAVKRGVSYTATATGIAIAISCNFVLLLILGVNEGGSVPQLRTVAVYELVFSTVLMLLLIAPFLELASLFPGSPGVRTYTKKSLGNTPSLLLTLSYILVLIIIASVESYLLVSILRTFIPWSYAAGITIATLALVVVVNYWGVAQSDAVQRWVTVSLWLGGVILCAAAYGLSNSAMADKMQWVQPDFSHFSEVSFEGIALGLFLFVGVELTATSVRHPSDMKTVLPVSVFSAVFLIALFYFVMCNTLLALQPSVIEGNNPLLYVGRTAFPTYGAFVALVLTALALLTSFNSGLKGASRIVYLLAQERILPAVLLKLSDDAVTPKSAVLCVGLIASAGAVLTLAFNLAQVLSVLSASLVCFVYAGLLIASLKVNDRKTRVRNYFNSRIPAPVRVAVISALVILGMANTLRITESVKGQVVMAIGVLVLAMACLLARNSSGVLSVRETELKKGMVT